jgi:hypothetical protein
MQPAHQRHGKTKDTGRDPRGVHQASGHDEEGDGQQRERIRPADHAVQDHQVRLDPLDDDVKQRGPTERDGHGHPDDEQHQETADERQGHH